MLLSNPFAVRSFSGTVKVINPKPCTMAMSVIEMVLRRAGVVWRLGVASEASPVVRWANLATRARSRRMIGRRASGGVAVVVAESWELGVGSWYIKYLSGPFHGRRVRGVVVIGVGESTFRLSPHRRGTGLEFGA